MTAIDPTKTHLVREYKNVSPLIACRFDATGRYLFACGQDSGIYRFDLLTGNKTPFLGHAGWVRSLSFAPVSAPPIPFATVPPTLAMGSYASLPSTPFTMISGDYHGKVKGWNGAALEPTPNWTINAHEGWVRAVAVSPDGKSFATCGNDHLVKLWSIDGQWMRTFEGHASHVYNVAFHPSGTRLVSCDLKGKVKDWEVATGKEIRELDAKVLHKYDDGFRADIGGARGMAFSPDGNTLALTGITNVSNAFAGVGNPIVVQFDWKDGKPKQLKPKETFQGTGWGVAVHPSGLTMAAGGAGNGRIWFWKGEENIHTVTVPANARDFTLHPSGTAVAVAGANSVAYVYSLVPTPFVAPPPAKKK
jgi:WD40 repeat protein